MAARQYIFRSTGPIQVKSDTLTTVPLSEPPERSKDVGYDDTGVVFRSEGWYEVLLEVQWDPDDRKGTRFSHTAIPGQEPLHSEAISAQVLAKISGGKQALRGNTIFGPDRTTSLILEVWHDSSGPVEVRDAALTIRELAVPWQPAGGSPG